MRAHSQPPYSDPPVLPCSDTPFPLERQHPRRLIACARARKTRVHVARNNCIVSGYHNASHHHVACFAGNPSKHIRASRHGGATSSYLHAPRRYVSSHFDACSLHQLSERSSRTSRSAEPNSLTFDEIFAHSLRCANPQFSVLRRRPEHPPAVAFVPVGSRYFATSACALVPAPISFSAGCALPFKPLRVAASP